MLRQVGTRSLLRPHFHSGPTHTPAAATAQRRREMAHFPHHLATKS